MGQQARAAATVMAAASTAAKNTALLALARRLREAGPSLQAANAKDLAKAADLAAPLRDRLKLDAKTLATVAGAASRSPPCPIPSARSPACAAPPASASARCACRWACSA